MKFQVTFKTPDALHDAVMDKATEVVSKRCHDNNIELDDHEWGDARDEQMNEYEKFAERWVRYGEYITVEFDTEAGTATVIPK